MRAWIDLNFRLGMVLIYVVALGMMVSCYAPDSKPAHPKPQPPGAGVSPQVPPPPEKSPTNPLVFLPKRK
jgi:hypothetical protein